MSAGRRWTAKVWAAGVVAVCAIVADACAQAEGIGADDGVGGNGGGAGDSSVGGAAGATSGGAAGSSTGGAAGAAGVAGSSSGGSSTGGGGAPTGGGGAPTGGGGTPSGGGGTPSGGGGTPSGGGGTPSGGGGTPSGGGGTPSGGGGTPSGGGGTPSGGGGTGATGGTGGSGGSGGCPIVTYPFTGCPTGWTTGGNNNDWQCGVPSVGPPNGDHTGGGQCWGTKLAGNANNCEDSTLTSPVVNLAAYTGQALRLRFWHYYDFRVCVGTGLCALPCALDKSTYSGGLVEVSTNGSTWTKIAPAGGYPGPAVDCYYLDPEGGATCSPCSIDGQTGFGGKSAGWELVEMDISSYAVAALQFRFHFASYGAEPICHPAKPGWYVDDVSIVKLACP